ncbi:hypothetical protein [Jhaorihella thermophila]|uniref:hypothetical protein n=1 Tax=Jhaorihella thermophila TaxID=488547 RepID=UPI003617286F
MTHFFQRDPGNIMHMFVIDGAARNFNKIWKGGIQSFISEYTDRTDLYPAPKDATGYVILLKDVNMKQGVYLFPPTPDQERQFEQMHQLAQE